MNQNYKLLFIGLILLSSCAKRLTETAFPKVKRVKTPELVSKLDSLSKIRPDSFYSKISTKYIDTTHSISVKTSLRMISDSALNMIVTYAAIPVVNAIITKDSLKVVNKREKCLVLTDMEFIKDKFGVDFTFKNLEEIILGIPLDYDTTQKYFQINDPHRHIISSHRKRRLRNNDRLVKDDDDVAVEYFINANLKQLDGLKIISASDTTSIDVSYKTWQFVNGINVPEEVIIRVSAPRNNLLMELTYSKVALNEPVELYFIVPEGYEECE